MEHVTGPRAAISSRKNDPSMNVAVIPHQTVTFRKCRGISVCIRGCPGAQMRNCVYWITQWSGNEARRSTEYFKIMIDQQSFLWENWLRMRDVMFCPYETALGYGKSCKGSSALCFWALFGRCCKNSLSVGKINSCTHEHYWFYILEIFSNQRSQETSSWFAILKKK